MNELLSFISSLVYLYEIIVIASVVLGLLIQLGVISGYQPFVRSLNQAFRTVTEPALRPIRRYVRPMNGVDLSPIVLIISCWFVRGVVIPVLARNIA